ncbi:MAG: hypothetical protein RXQ99_10295 [Acidianus sp.]|uniref:hypothetical protein n=1 Tax=Acidianus sp. TaxID=1872104 RepID=UPI00397A767F
MDASLIKLLSKESKMKQEEIEERLSSASKAIQYVISFNYEEKYTESVTLSGNYKFIRLKPFNRLSFKKVFLSTSSKILEGQVKMNAEGKGEVKIKDLGNFQNEIEITFNGKGKEMEVYELEFKVVFTNELLKDIKKYLEIQEKVYGTKRLFSINFNVMLSPILRYRQSLSFPRLKEAMAIEAKYLNKKGFPEKFKVLDFLKVNNGLTEFLIDFPDFGYIGIIYEIE